MLEEMVAGKTIDLKQAVDALSDAKTALEEKNVLLLQANEKLQFLSDCDGLTGIANRRRLDAAMEGEWARCRRQKSPLSFVLLDLDHFKALNDRHGHQAGDECLRAVGEALRKAKLRQTDLAARYGGEEFGLLLPNTDIQGAQKVAEHIRCAIEGLGMRDSEGEPFRLTASFGVASIRPRAGTSCEDLILAADTALYRAKSLGRNQVICAPDPF